MARKRQTPHPDDDTLLALVEDSSTESNHVASCSRCTQRVDELGAMRRLLLDIAGRELHPQHDIAQRAVGRLRMRRTAIGNVNEVFAAVRALIRGLADLFGGGPPADASGTLPGQGKGAPHG